MIILGYEYSSYRTNEDGEREYFVDAFADWMTRNELKEYLQEVLYWETWAEKINPNEG